MGDAMRALVLALIGCLLQSAPAAADDSLASLGAGGVQLLRSDNIVLERQDLFLSPDLVTVDFTFRNHTPNAVESLVAFVLPDLSADDYRRRFWGLSAPHGVNFLSFSGTVDGHPITPRWDIRAIATDGTDITEKLISAGADPNFFALDAIPEIRTRLTSVGAVDEDGIPAWTMRTRLYWPQSFPPGRPMRITHSYRPLTGGTELLPQMLDDSRDHQGLAAEYCMDDQSKAAALQLAEAASRSNRAVSLRFIDYALTTGANWAGPIGTLSIVVEAGTPDRLLATCFPGLHKVGQGRMEGRIDGLEPDKDIHVMIVTPP